MIVKTYLDKFATIVKGSDLNSGLNQVAELHYGKDNIYSRILVHFNHDKIKKCIEEKIFGNVSKVKHYLHIFNTSGLDATDLYTRKPSEITNEMTSRACSFDLIFFLIPKDWDNGKGYDMSIGKRYLKNGNTRLTSLVSTDGCNWFKAKNGSNWDENGVYSNQTLSKEYEAFGTESGSTVIFARQHFDIGDENIHIDITDVVNDFINNKRPNYGFGIAFSPLTELTTEQQERFAAFFSPKTHTFFEPYVESVYEDYISDDRGNFTLKKDNKLYFYSYIDGMPCNLDYLPTCKIDTQYGEKEFEVKQYSKGIYYCEIPSRISSSYFNGNRMYSDVWGNLVYNGEDFEDIEMDFVVKPSSNVFSFGNGLKETKHVTPIIYGIKQGEEIHRNDDLRKVCVVCRQDYTKNQVLHPTHMSYRLYVMDGKRELTVLTDNINNGLEEEYFNIEISSLIPNQYFIDVTIEYPQEKITYKNVISFSIMNDITNKYN